MVESEPDTDDAESHVGYIDTGVKDMPVDGDETEEEAYSDKNEQDSDNTGIDYGVWTVECGEVVGDGNVDEDEVDVLDAEEDVFEDEMEVFDADEDVFEDEMEVLDAEEDEEESEEDDDEDEVAHPVRRVRNAVDSDDDGETAARAVHPPGTMAVFDELAPRDIHNPCEFQIKVNTVM